MALFRQFGRLRRATCVEERHCPGNPAKPRGIPVAPDARERVETVRAGSAMDETAGYYAAKAAERETARSHAMVKRERRAEMTRPLAFKWREVTICRPSSTKPAYISGVYTFSQQIPSPRRSGRIQAGLWPAGN